MKTKTKRSWIEIAIRITLIIGMLYAVVFSLGYLDKKQVSRCEAYGYDGYSGDGYCCYYTYQEPHASWDLPILKNCRLYSSLGSP